MTATLANSTKLGIALAMVRMVKTGRLTQYVEPNSEAEQLLERDGWKRSKQPLATFIEIDTPIE